MKVAIYHVTCTFALGGSEAYAWSLARFLTQRGHTVHLVAGSVPHPITRFPEPTLKSARFMSRDRLPWTSLRTRKLIERLSFGVACRRLFVDERYDVINIHKTYDIPFALWARKRTGCRIVWRSHGPGLFVGARHLVHRVDRIFAVSDITRDAVQRAYGIDAPVIHTGVDTDFFRPSKRNTIDGTARLLYFGRLQRFKGVEYLVQALSRITELDWTARIVGDGPEKVRLKAQIAALNLADRVVVEPPLRAPEGVRSLLDESTIVCFPSSEKDTFSNAVLEAMSMGRAVIASDVGGFPEAITSGEAGLLVPHGNPDAIADAIKTLLHSRDVLEAMSSAARARIVKHFPDRANFDRVEQLMAQSIADKPRSVR